jgi:hypothetical protein
MQNKPNLLNNQMSITFCLTNYYEQKTPLRQSENKPNSKPIKPNFCSGCSCISLIDRPERRNKYFFTVSKGFNEQKLMPKALSLRIIMLCKHDFLDIKTQLQEDARIFTTEQWKV